MKKINSGQYVHEVWYTTTERSRCSNTGHTKRLQHWSRENAPSRQLIQVSNVDAIKNETPSVTG